MGAGHPPNGMSPCGGDANTVPSKTAYRPVGSRCDGRFLLRTVLLAPVVGIGVTTFSKPVHASYKTLIWLSTGIKVQEWVTVHRKHQAHTDTALDPHSPAVGGWTWDRVVFDRSGLGRGAAVNAMGHHFGRRRYANSRLAPGQHAPKPVPLDRQLGG